MAEQREILEKLSAETLRDMVVDLQRALKASKLDISCLKVQVKDRGNSYKAKVEENERLRATLKEVSECQTEHGTEKLCDGCLISIADALMTIPDCKTCTHYKAPCTQNQYSRDCTGYIAESIQPVDDLMEEINEQGKNEAARGHLENILSRYILSR